ncbi:putative HNH endonuclease [Pectobacterium phage DU_PP_I]|nr:putative HNH endonuclease [Pectobacterium phage DU_PP_I]ATS93977.1 putative HNH endonuclease [Pectobacterium phage DU_PP_IV]
MTVSDLPFKYDPGSPSGFTWTQYRKGSRGIGTVVGTKGSKGYWIIKVPEVGRKRAHRLVWEIHNGPIPDGKFVDHIDGNLDNTAIENLRLCDEKQSARNTTGWSGKQLPKGIHENFHGGKTPGYYQARLKVGGKNFTKSSYHVSELTEWLQSLRDLHHEEFRRD